jgi:cytochrome c553
MLKGLVSTIVAAAAIAAGTAAPAAAQEVDAQAQVCSVCHGQNGMPIDPKTMPIIWGQQESYLVKQLHDYRSGDRDNAIMASMAKTIKQDDIRKIAHYFAAKTWPPNPAGNASAPEPKGAAACKICHQPKFEGGLPAPRLAGLSYEYLVVQMRNFADGTRENNMDMPKYMQALTESERDAIAKYLAGL